MSKASILVVNGGKDPENGKWLSLFTNKLYEMTDKEKFNLIVWNNNTDDENVKKLKDIYGFELLEPLKNDVMFHPHAVPLQRLYNYTIKKHDPEIVIVMDSDAFPIKKGWFEKLTDAVLSGEYILAGVWRDEFEHDITPYVHASCMCFPTKFIQENNLRLDFYGINTDTKKHDTLSAFTEKAIEKDYKVYKLKRSNKNNFHRLMGGIYGDYVYHHGAGSRSDITFWDEKGNTDNISFNTKVNINSSYLLFNKFSDYISWLKNINNTENLDFIISDNHSNLNSRREKQGVFNRIFKKKPQNLDADKGNFLQQKDSHYNYMEGHPTEEHLNSLEKPSGWNFSFPDIVGIGVPKAGTSWWFDNLLSHPHIIPHRFYNKDKETSKELHFFNHIKNNFITDNQKEIYKKCFLKQEGVLCAEFSTVYFQNTFCLENLLKTVNESTKFVLILRNPVDRFFSHINHLMKNRTIRLELKNNQDKEFFNKYSVLPEATYYSLYSDHLDFLLSKIGKNRIYIDTYENIKKNPEKSYRKFIDFMGLQQYYIPSYYQDFDYNKPKNKQEYIITKPSTKEREIIYQSFRADIDRIHAILPELDLTDWHHK